MSGDLSAQEKNFRNGLVAALSNREEIPSLEEAQALAAQMAPLFNFKGDLQDVVNEARTSVVTKMGAGVSLIDPNTKHDDQWARKREDIKWTYSNAYEGFLQEDGWADPMVQSLSDVTGKILGLLQNPQEEGSWDRRGLVIGHVQSGKTANYTGLIAKAADAGYRFIIVIAGIHNNLRKQTQERIDEAFIGRNSDPDDRKNIGVGLNKDYPHPATLTTVNGDFNKQTASQGWKLADVNKPVILIIKKNVSTLTSLYKWLRELNATGDGLILDVPMLMIDDEADNASVNTNREDVNPTKTNAEIRNILNLFAKSCYVGYTATPFANIFIDPDAYDEKVREELFPKDFIYCLDAPSTYFGAEKVFLNEQTSDTVVKTITDCEDLLPFSHKREDKVSELPPSLYRALNQFIVARAIRNLRGQRRKHCSMMINVSRFVPIQKAVRDFISLRERKMREAVKSNYMMPESVSSQNIYMQELKAAFDEEYAASGCTWEEVKAELNGVFDHLHLYVVNSKSEDDLDFGKYEKEGVGLTAIAVGGLSLSRGLTIEGLTVSYMYRNTKMYDTLMQMGRWFGYRPNFEDLCRVYLSQDSINWYAHIAHSSGELISQVYRMRQLKKSPKDFGLYVRKHPDSLLITARNKMRTGTEVILEQTLSGCLREAYTVLTDEAANKKNYDLIEEYWKRNFDGELENTERKGWIARDVPLKTIEDFILHFETHEDWQQDKEFIVEYLHAIAKLYPKGDVLLISPRDGEGGDEEYHLKHQLRAQSKGQPDKGGWHLNKNRVASRGDESLGLTDIQIEAAKAAAKKQAEETGSSSEPSDTHYRSERNKPLLMIHSLKARLPKDGSNPGPAISHPVATYGVSFPFDGHGTTIVVVANKVWVEKNRRALVDDNLDDGDEIE
ncbi:endonuclease [Agrobacterium salinitolerans]|uniref:Z1 domain-containing protein n=1 Tax=Agrobacterium salinitolerans TaxID=1183413 RepID=UPI001C24990A|nr:Z1 domain-containing protein [Agrobacterium salinitolerans]QXC48794.1 endonuclease [Agrobacterium salinitolerans]